MVRHSTQHTAPRRLRELFPAQEASFRVSLAISVTLAGMALGGWLAGAIYDWTGSYMPRRWSMAIAWNIMNMAIAVWLLHRRILPRRLAARRQEVLSA